MVATAWAGTFGLKNLTERGMIGLVKIRAGRHLTSWTLTSAMSITYETTPTIPTNDDGAPVHGLMTFDRVLVDGGVELTSRASAAEVEANPGSFYWNGTKLYVSMADSTAIWKHTVIPEFPIYLCSGSWEKRCVFLDSNLWWPRIAGVDTFTRRIADIFDPRIIVPSVRIELVCGTDWDNIFRDYRWHNRSVEILIGGDDLPYSEYIPVFTGKVRDLKWAEEYIEIEAVGTSAAFDTAFPPEKISEDTTTETYDLVWVKHPSTLYQIAPTTINADCATEDAKIGAPIPWVAGSDIYLREAPLVAYASNYAMWAVGRNAMVTAVRRLSSGVTTNWTWTDTSPLAWWWYDSDAGMLYGPGNADPHSASFWFTLQGPHNEEDSPAWPTGPRYELAPDIVRMAVADCGIAVEWDETVMDEARFLTSTMELQVYQTEATTLGEFLSSVCRSVGAVIFERADGSIAFKVLSPDYRDYVDIDEAYADFQDWESHVEHLQSYTKVNVGWGALTQQAFDTGRDEMVSSFDCPEYAAESASNQAFDVLGTFLKTDAGALTLASRIARWAADHPQKFRILTTIRHADVDIGDTVRIRKARRPIPNDSYSQFAVVVGVGINLNDATVYLDVIERFQFRQAYIGAASSAAWGSATADAKRTIGYVTDDDGASAANDNSAWKVSQEF